MCKTFLTIIVLIVGPLFSNPFEPLNIDFLKRQKQKNNTHVKQQDFPKKKKGDLPAYEEVINDLEIIEGLF